MKFNEEQRKEIVGGFENGLTIKEIATMMDLDYHAVRNCQEREWFCKMAGTEYIPRAEKVTNGTGPKRKKKESKEQINPSNGRVSDKVSSIFGTQVISFEVSDYEIPEQQVFMDLDDLFPYTVNGLYTDYIAEKRAEKQTMKAHSDNRKKEAATLTASIMEGLKVIKKEVALSS